MRVSLSSTIAKLVRKLPGSTMVTLIPSGDNSAWPAELGVLGELAGQRAVFAAARTVPALVPGHHGVGPRPQALEGVEAVEQGLLRLSGPRSVRAGRSTGEKG
jgi:hypothetical protein